VGGGDEDHHAADCPTIMDEEAMMKLLEGDFDPDKFEQLMKAQYNDDFYQKDDPEWKTDADVKNALLQDEDGKLLTGGDVDGLYDDHEEEEQQWEEAETPNDEFVYDAAADGGGDDDKYYTDEEGDDGDNAMFQEQHGESAIEKKLKAKLQEELYKLDYEDLIDGMPTRFKYRQVEKNDYGLTTKEILFARDSTLKGFVSLKKMAPYRDEGEYHVHRNKRRRFREQLKHELEEEEKKIAAEKQEQQQQQEEEEEAQEKPKKKRRRQKKGKKKDKETSVEDRVDDTGAGEGETESQKHEELKKADGGKKRRRKKKARKETVESSNTHDDVSTTERQEDQNAPSTATTTKDDQDASSRTKTTKKRKKSKKKKKIEGVSASRLGAYGL